MTSDLDCATACLHSYLPGSGEVEIGTDLCALPLDVAGCTVVAFRGTTNVQGWLRDFDAVPIWHKGLGLCHGGFLYGASQLWNRMTIPQDRPVVLTGHSLGGALAVLVAALRVLAGERVDALVTFGAPRAGYQSLADRLAATSVRQYRRGNDPVPEVPFDLPAFPYKHVREPLVSIGTTQSEAWRAHAITGYVTDLGSTAGSVGL